MPLITSNSANTIMKLLRLLRPGGFFRTGIDGKGFKSGAGLVRSTPSEDASVTTSCVLFIGGGAIALFWTSACRKAFANAATEPYRFAGFLDNARISTTSTSPEIEGFSVLGGGGSTYIC